MQKNSIKNTIMLLLAAMIWGFAFVAQSTGNNTRLPIKLRTALKVNGPT